MLVVAAAAAAAVAVRLVDERFQAQRVAFGLAVKAEAFSAGWSTTCLEAVFCTLDGVPCAKSSVRYLAQARFVN